MKVQSKFKQIIRKAPDDKSERPQHPQYDPHDEYPTKGHNPGSSGPPKHEPLDPRGRWITQGLEPLGIHVMDTEVVPRAGQHEARFYVHDRGFDLTKIISMCLSRMKTPGYKLTRVDIDHSHKKDYHGQPATCYVAQYAEVAYPAVPPSNPDPHYNPNNPWHDDDDNGYNGGSGGSTDIWAAVLPALAGMSGPRGWWGPRWWGWGWWW